MEMKSKNKIQYEGLTNKLRDRYVSWYQQAKENKVNIKKLENQFLNNDKTTINTVTNKLQFKDGTK